MTKEIKIPIREDGSTTFLPIAVPETGTGREIRLPARPRTGNIEANYRSLADALGPGRLSASWLVNTGDVNEELSQYISTLRDKARSLEYTSDFVRRFLAIAEANVIGSEGFRLQVRARMPDGNIDRLDSALAERLWNEYSKGRNISVDGRTNLRQIEGLIVRGLLRDGEVFLRKVIRKKDRRFPLKLQFVPPEFIDDQLNKEESTTHNEIIMGVEVDEYGAPVAYHVITDDAPGGYIRGHERVPAGEIFHIYIKTRSDQVRGYSALVSSIFALKMLDGIKEASVTNFRVSASKMGFFTRTAEGVQYEGDGKDSAGNIIANVAPGQFELLPPGTGFAEFNPTFPAEQFDGFMKAVVRSIASGWGVSYNGLANDYAEVNYSSARVAQLEERELWKKLQREVEDQFLDPLYSSWLSYAILTQTLPVPEARFDKFNEKKFVGRSWTWVDPEAEVNANAKAIANGLKSRSLVCAEQGLDFEDVAEELAREEEIAKAYGITISETVAPPAPIADEIPNNGETPE